MTDVRALERRAHTRLWWQQSFPLGDKAQVYTWEYLIQCSSSMKPKTTFSLINSSGRKKSCPDKKKGGAVMNYSPGTLPRILYTSKKQSKNTYYFYVQGKNSKKLYYPVNLETPNSGAQMQSVNPVLSASSLLDSRGQAEISHKTSASSSVNGFPDKRCADNKGG